MIIPVAIIAIAAVCILYVIPEKTDVRITKQGIAKVEPILNSKGKKVGHLVKDDGYMKTYQINSTDAEGLVIYKDDKFSVTVGSAQSVIVKNTTSDNKQILFKTAAVAYNGLGAFSSYNPPVENILSGEQKEIALGNTIIDDVSSDVGAYVKKVEEITYYIGYSVGMNSDPKIRGIDIRLSNYNQKDIDRPFKNKIDDFKTGELRYSAYRIDKKDGNGFYVLLKNTGKVPIEQDWGCFGGWLINGNRQEMVSIKDQHIYDGMTEVYEFSLDPKEYRKQFEIPDSTPLRIRMGMGTTKGDIEFEAGKL